MALRVVAKVGWFWRTLDFLVKLVTLWRVRDFLTDYATTIGNICGVPVAWGLVLPDELAAHEGWHVQQQRRLGLGSVWVGLVPWGIAWLFLPLPIGLAWCRYALERSAYVKGFHAKLDDVLDPSERKAARADMIDFAVKQMTGASYGWAWPFPKAVRRWFEEHV